MKFLLVDDTEYNRVLPRVLLQRKGLAVVECDNGEEALRLAGSGEFDCILLDVMMPGLSGIEVCQRLRALPGLRQPRIVAYTAHAMPAEVRTIMAAGFDEILIKPVDIKRLLTALGVATD